MNVRICPEVDIYYHSAYVQGLFDRFGQQHVSFGREGFAQFEPRGPLEQGDALAFIIEETGQKFFIDAQDRPELSAAGLDWCDAYGKVNYEPELIPASGRAKVVPIGQAFSFRLHGPAASAWHAVRNYLIGRGRITMPKRFLAHWRTLYRDRLPEHAYTPGVSEADYAFFSSSLWGDFASGNRLRANFVDAARSCAGLRFEGGFREVRRDDPVYNPFRAQMVRHTPGHVEYIAKTRRSAVVFNSPSRLGCHGWKIAEFLAMGKAIVSVPMTRALPVPLVHGEHIHFTDGSVEQNREAILRICQDASYRKHLERGARAYYLEHLHPIRAVERLLAHDPQTAPVLIPARGASIPARSESVVTGASA